jgi:hypothetical protein
VLPNKPVREAVSLMDRLVRLGRFCWLKFVSLLFSITKVVRLPALVILSVVRLLYPTIYSYCSKFTLQLLNVLRLIESSLIY